MKRIPFDLQYRSQIESGEYKVVTDMGEPVEIVKWNCRGRCPILAVIDDGDTDDSCFYKADGVSLNGVDSLFILINESEPNEFEKSLADILMYREYEGSTETEDDIEKGMIPFITAAKQYAPRLLEIARKEFVKSDTTDDLTWEDMLIIHKHIKDAMNKFLYAFQTPEGQKKVYEDVLRRFKESKENKTLIK